MARLSADEVSAARHVPIASVVAAVVQLNRQGFGLCPFHSERTPSFHVHIKRNSFKCFSCGAGGSPIDFVQRTRGVDFCSAVQMLLGGSVSLKPDRQIRELITRESPRTQGNVGEYVQRLWGDADAPDVAEFYLASRGIRVRPRPLPWAVRGTRRCWCRETGQYRSALLAAVSAGDGSVMAVQRIWTESSYVGGDPKGAKARLTSPKKTIGGMGRGAVQLSEPSAALGIAEGVESGLSAAMMYRMPVWAALGAGRMGSIALPEIVRQVIVFGDNGEDEEKTARAHEAAHDAVSAYQRRGYASQAVFPDPIFGDFNDQLRSKS